MPVATNRQRFVGCCNPLMAVTSQLPAFGRTIFHVDMDAFFVSVEELLILP